MTDDRRYISLTWRRESSSTMLKAPTALSLLVISLCHAEVAEKLKIEAESIATIEGTVVVKNPHASGGKLLQFREGDVPVQFSLDLRAGGYRVRLVGLAESRYSDSIYFVLNDKRKQRVFHRISHGDTPTEGKPKDMEWATTAKFSFVFSIDKDGEQKLTLTAPKASGPGRFKSGRGPGVLIDYFEFERDEALGKLLLRMKTYDVEKVVARITKPKPLFRETPIVKDGKPLAAIAVSLKDDAQKKAAEDINRYVADLVGVKLPIVEASEGAEALLAKTHLIAPGSLMTNSVVGRLYDTDFAYSDAEYPGKGGWVVRSVCDPFGAGRNVIVLGGSDPEGIAEATANFVRLLQKDEMGDIVLPLTREIHVGPRLAEVPAFAKAPRFRSDTLKRIRESVQKSGTKRLEDALDKDAHVYSCFGHDVGAKFFRERLLAALEYHPGKVNILFLKADAFRCLAHAFDLVEEVPVFSDAERLSITRFLLRKTLEHANASIYEEAQTKDEAIGNSHWGWPSCANLVNYCAYFRKYYELPELDELWQNRLLPFVAKHDTVFKPTEEATGYMEYIGQMKAHMGLALGRRDFFASGAAAKNADLLGMVITNNGSLPGFGDASGPRSGARHGPKAARCFFDMMTRATGDGRYVWLRKKYMGNNGYESPKSYYPRRYFTGIEPVEPKRHIGLFVQPLDPTHCPAPPKLEPGERLFDKLTFRTGWGDGNDYLLLSGIGMGIHRHRHTNAIIRYQAKGKDWLMDDSYDYRRKGERDHCSIIYSRDGKVSALPEVARLQHAEDLGSFAFVRSAVSPYGDVGWERDIIWRRNEFAVVFDVLRARTDGDYSFRALWLVNGETALEGRRLKVTQDDKAFFLHHAGSAEQFLQTETGFDVRWKGLGQLMTGRLTAGQDRYFKNTSWAQDGSDEPRYELLPLPLGAALLVGPDGPAVVGVGDGVRPLEVGQLTVVAKAFYVSARHMALWEARGVKCGEAICEATEPVSFQASLTTGEAKLTKGSAAIARTPKGKEEWQQLQPAVSKALGELKVLAGSAEKEFGQGLPAAVPVEWAAKGEGVPIVSCMALKGKASGLAIARGKGISIVDAGGKVLKALEMVSDVTALATGDIDGDGTDEVVIGMANGGLRAAALEGGLVWETKLPKGRGPAVTAIAAADITGDGKCEVLAGGNHRKLFAIDGTTGKGIWTCDLGLASYPHDQAVSALGIGDLNADGIPDIAVATRVFNGRLVSGKGALMTRVSHASYPHNALVRDLSGDKAPEVVFDSEHGVLHAYNAKGTPLWTFNAGDEVRTLTAADLDGDGTLEVLFGGHLGTLYCLNADATEKWHRSLGQPISSVLTFAGPGNVAQILVGTRTGRLHKVSATGKVVASVAVSGEIESMLPLRDDVGLCVAVALRDGPVVGIRPTRLPTTP